MILSRFTAAAALAGVALSAAAAPASAEHWRDGYRGPPAAYHGRWDGPPPAWGGPRDWRWRQWRHHRRHHPWWEREGRYPRW